MNTPRNFILLYFFLLSAALPLSGQDTAQAKTARWYNGVRFSGIADGRKVNGLNFSISNESPYHKKAIVNGMDFALLWSGIDRVNGVHITPGISFGNRDNGLNIAGVGASPDRMNGLLLTGLFGVVDGTCNGLSISGAGAYNGRMNGIALAGLVAGADTSFNGICLTPLFAWTGRMSGFSFGGLLNYSQGLNGMAIGIYNFNSNCTNGLQLGALNLADSLRGLQVGFWNVVESNPRILRSLPFINIGLSRLARYPILLKHEFHADSTNWFFDQLERTPYLVLATGSHSSDTLFKNDTLNMHQQLNLYRGRGRRARSYQEKPVQSPLRLTKSLRLDNNGYPEYYSCRVAENSLLLKRECWYGKYGRLEEVRWQADAAPYFFRDTVFRKNGKIHFVTDRSKAACYRKNGQLSGKLEAGVYYCYDRKGRLLFASAPHLMYPEKTVYRKDGTVKKKMRGLSGTRVLTEHYSRKGELLRSGTKESYSFVQEWEAAVERHEAVFVYEILGY